MAFGLDNDGFKRKRLADIREDLEDDFRGEFGNSIVTNPRSVFGTLIGIMAGVISPLWEGLESLYWGLDPDRASGQQLDNLGAIIGVDRLEPTPSNVTLELSGADGTTVPAGSEVAHSGTGKVFVTDSDATIQGGSVEVSATSREKGEIVALAGSLTVIQSTVSGWDSVTNPEDAQVGRERETDAEYRARQRESLRIAGASTYGAIRAQLAQLDGVETASVVENDASSVDAAGRAPHSFEAIVEGGNDQEIANTIWDLKPVGIDTSNSGTSSQTVSVTVYDIDKRPHEVTFTRIAYKDVWVSVDVSIESSASWNPGGSESTAIIEAILEETDTYGAGTDAKYWAIEQIVMGMDLIQERLEVIESVDVSINDASAVTASNHGSVEIPETKIPDFSSSRISVFFT